jgi:hypothetical protein
MNKLTKKSDIISIMESWQSEGMKSLNLVHVSYFTLQPQAQGFYLEVEFYIADKYDPEMGYEKKWFYGSLIDCFDQALNYIEEERERLKALL